MKRILKILLNSLIVAFVVGLVYLIVFRTSLFTVKNIIVNGHVEVAYEEIVNSAGIDIGQNIFSVNSKAVIQNLQGHSWIGDAVVRKEYPNTVNLEIIERKPLVVLEYASNYLVLDRELIVLEAGANERELYIINGIAFQNFSIGNEIDVDDEYILRNTIDLIELIEKSHMSFMPMINVGDDSIELKISERMFAKFGSGEDIEKKFNNFLDVYEDLTKNGTDSGLIDLRFKGSPIFKPVYGEEE